jgi:hypothetical protein
MAHSWEQPGHSWDRHEHDSEEEFLTPAEQAGVAFMEVLLDLYMTSAMGANTFCILCYWAHAAGIQGAVATYGVAPGKQSSYYQKVLNSKLHFKEERDVLYNLPVPGVKRHELSRCMVDVLVRPGHEAFQKEVSNDCTFSVKLREAIEGGLLPPSYHQHPIVVSNPGEVIAPIAIYMDGLPYSQVDSVLGVWLINVVTGMRHLIASIRKKMTCACGCRGWCSYFSVLQFIRWFLVCMANGEYPEVRHDGNPFVLPRDQWREDLAGEPLAYKSCCIHLKGDWAEFCERLGYPTWQSGLRPCFCCATSGAEMYNPQGVSFLVDAWHVNTKEDYNDACSRCEIWVNVNACQHEAICNSLRYDKRVDGARGLALLCPIPGLPLLRGDRLEPHPECPDVSMVFEMSEFPCRLLFWRRANETICTRRCPLFCLETGMYPTTSIAIDALHTLFLGPMQSWAKMAVWSLLTCGIWGQFESTSEEQILVAIIALRSALLHWYTTPAGAGCTRVNTITKKMLGTPDYPVLKMKAMETFGFVRFLLDCLDAHGARVPDGRMFLESGRLLVDMVNIMKTGPTTLSPLILQEPFFVIMAP